jgi:hypothetical protein
MKAISIRQRIRSSLPWAVVVAGILPLPAATPVVSPQVDQISDDTEHSDDVVDSISRRNKLNNLFGNRTPRWLDSYQLTRDKWLERANLEIGAIYSVAGMSSIGNGSPDYGVSGDLTISGVWHLGGDKWDRPFDLRFRVRDRHAIGGKAASELFNDSGGVLWNMIDGFSNAGFEIPDFQLVQHLPLRGIEIRYGQMTIDSQFDRHGLRSSKQAFLNRAFSSNPAVAFPRFGTGATILWKPDDRGFDFTLGGTSVQGSQNGNQVDLKLASSSFFTAAQFGRDFKIDGNPARFQAMLWHSDALEEENLPAGKGFSLTYEHWLPSKDARMFLRTAWADSEATATDRMITAGFAVDRCKNDLFGFALGAGRDSSGSDDWQGVLETFYRRQVGPTFQVTPAAQLIFGSGLEDHPVRFIFGLRGQLVF